MCFYQVTTHSHLLSSVEVEELGNSLQLSENPDVDSFILQEFDTELDFTSNVRYANILYLKAQYITFSPHHLLGCELEPHSKPRLPPQSDFGRHRFAHVQHLYAFTRRRARCRLLCLPAVPRPHLRTFFAELLLYTSVSQELIWYIQPNPQPHLTMQHTQALGANVGNLSQIYVANQCFI